MDDEPDLFVDELIIAHKAMMACQHGPGEAYRAGLPAYCPLCDTIEACVPIRAVPCKDQSRMDLLARIQKFFRSLTRGKCGR